MTTPARVALDADRTALVGDLEALRAAWAGRSGVTALTGAGISVESGIPDFRSEGGLWSRFDPMEYATLECFLGNPDKSWRLFRELGTILLDKEPNAAHRALADMERDGDLKGILTQNIDRLHQAAGSRSVVELHGSHDTLRCLGCGHCEPFSRNFLAPGPAPSCPACGHPLKPNVVLYGEPVRDATVAGELLDGCRTMLVIGTSAETVPACLFPEAVLESGGDLLEFNLAPTARTRAGLGAGGVLVEGPVGETLPLFLEEVSS